MKRLLIPLLALALCPAAQAEMVTWKRTHLYRRASHGLPASQTVTTHSIDPNTATRVGELMIAGSYEIEYYKDWNRSFDLGRTHTIYANCSSGKLVIESDPPYTFRNTYKAQKPDAWIEFKGKWSHRHDNESWQRGIEIAEGTQFGKGHRDDNLRMSTPAHEANSTAYALLCQDIPPQHKKVEGTHLSSLWGIR